MSLTVPIGGDFLSSMLSQLYIVPFQGTQTFTSLGSLNTTTYPPFDVVRSEPRRINLLDDSTHTGYGFSKGVRNTGWDFEWRGLLKWNPDLPMEQYINLASNADKIGCQIYASIGTSAQSVSGASGQYYWCPSVFKSFGATKIDVSGAVPKLIEFELFLKANAPCFFLPTDNIGSPSILQYYINNIVIPRGWAF